MKWRQRNVRFGSLADMTARSRHVRLTLDSGHSSARFARPLSVNSGLKCKNCDPYPWPLSGPFNEL